VKVVFTPENINKVICAEAVDEMINSTSTIGVINFLFDPATRILRSKITVVGSQYRGRGIATFLWEEVIREYSPVIVSVSTVSVGGDKLIKSLQRRYKNIEWDIW